jgi:hypothetical protein
MKRNRLLIILFSAAILFFAASCGRDADDANNEDDISLENRDGIDDQQTTLQYENQFWTSHRDYTFDQRTEFRDDVNTALNRLNRKITDLEETAANAAGDTKEWYNNRIADLKDQRSEIQKDLDAFNKVTADSWDDFKSGITSTWKDIENSWSQMVQEELKGDQSY